MATARKVAVSIGLPAREMMGAIALECTGQQNEVTPKLTPGRLPSAILQLVWGHLNLRPIATKCDDF